MLHALEAMYYTWRVYAKSGKAKKSKAFKDLFVLIFIYIKNWFLLCTPKIKTFQ